MSTEVENRVLEMKFNNAAFEKGVSTTLSSLDKLKQKLNFTGVKKGLDELKSADQGMTFDGMARGIDTLNQKFSKMNIIGVTAIANIANRAVNAGVQLVKSFTIAPLAEGFHQYEQQIQATQTILSNTSASGENLASVTKVLGTLNDYANATVYNFSDMATAMGSFTSAGIKLKPASIAIQGMANVAAAAGSNAQQMANVLPQISQALSRGKVQAQDWMSVTNAGMASSNFKNAILETAKAMGTLEIPKTQSIEDWTKKGGSFQQAMEKGQITSKVLSSTLEVMSGTLTDAQLAQRGYTKEQIKSLQTMAKQARAAAVNVKSFTALKDNLQQGVGSAWAQVYKSFIGDLPHATKLFTGLSKALNTVFVDPVNRLNTFVASFAKLGGVEKIFQGIQNIFYALGHVLAPIKKAFRDIFPATTVAGAVGMARAFEYFTRSLTPSVRTMENLKRTFRGLFAIVDIAKLVISGFVGGLVNLFRQIHGGTGSILGFTGMLGNGVVAFDKYLHKTQAIGKFFNTLSNYIAAPITMLEKLVGAVAHFFGRFDLPKLGRITGFFSAFSISLSPVASASKKASGFLTELGKALEKIAGVIGHGLANVGTVLAKAFNGATFDRVLHVIDTGLLAGIFLLFKKFLSKSPDIGGGFFGQIRETLGSVNDTLKLMQTQIKSNIILKIAEALALLTASVFVLSTIDASKLAKALAALGVGLVELGVALVAFNKYIGVVGAAKLPLITAAIVALAGALILMAVALKIMASIKPEDTGRSLLNLGAMLLIMSKTLQSLGKNSKGTIAAATAIAILAGALVVMAGALKLFSLFDWKSMEHGFAGIAGTLAIIALAMRLMPKGMVAQAAGMVILGVALNEIAGALKIFATLKWKEMGRGLTALAGALAIIVLAMTALPPTLPITAAGLLIVSVALTALAGALKIMATMSWKEIGKATTVLAASLLILAVAMEAMMTGLPGAAALLVMSAALAVLAPVLAILGGLSWTEILKSLAALAGVFVILGLAGLVLGPLIPEILGLAAALLVIGIGIVLVGAGALALATAFGILASVGVAGVKVLSDVLMVFVQALPGFVKALVDALVGAAIELGNQAPAFVASMFKILDAMLNGIITSAPKIAKAFLALINAGLTVVVNSAPKLASAGLTLLLSLLHAISNNIYRIVTVAGDIIIRFLKAIGDKSPAVISQAVQTIIDFINGLSKAIDDHAEELGAAGARLGVAIVKGMVKGIAGGAKEVADSLVDVGKGAYHAAAGFFGVHSPSRLMTEFGKYTILGWVNGIAKNGAQVAQASVDVASNTMRRTAAVFANMTNMFNIDSQPTISPVIDLTEVRKGADQLTKLLGSKPINANVSVDNARLTSSEHAEAQAQAEVNPLASVRSLTFEQKNYSPEALSTTEIYRRTHNQLALAKAALGVPG